MISFGEPNTRHHLSLQNVAERLVRLSELTFGSRKGAWRGGGTEVDKQRGGSGIVRRAQNSGGGICFFSLCVTYSRGKHTSATVCKQLLNWRKDCCLFESLHLPLPIVGMRTSSMLIKPLLNVNIRKELQTSGRRSRGLEQLHHRRLDRYGAIGIVATER